MTFASLLRSHRRAARMTLRDLADASGVSARAISDMERGHSTAPQKRTLDALASALTLNPAQQRTLIEAASEARAFRARPSYAPPRDVPDFTGRTAELAVLSPSRRAVIHGQPGVGKTALAVHAAAALRSEVHFLDGQAGDLHVRLQRIPADAVLILDNVTAEPVPQPPATARLWITSRRRLPTLTGATHLHVKPLTPQESATLLTEITGTPDPAVSEVADYCGHLPLALRIAGNRVAGRPGWTMTHLAARLSDESRRVSTLTAGDLSLESTLNEAFAVLSRPARDICQVTAHLKDFDARTAAALTGLPADVAHEALSELLDHDLIQATAGATSFRHHPLIRTHAVFGTHAARQFTRVRTH
ncbi:helix-turn-helix domain-containing protein [Actinoplanes sp. CA-131856]